MKLKAITLIALRLLAPRPLLLRAEATDGVNSVEPSQTTTLFLPADDPNLSLGKADGDDTQMNATTGQAKPRAQDPFAEFTRIPPGALSKEAKEQPLAREPQAAIQ